MVEGSKFYHQTSLKCLIWGSLTLVSLHLPLIGIKLRKSILKLRQSILVKWSPPTSNTLKLNIDGVAKGNHDLVGAGGVIRNSSNVVISTCSSYL